MPFIAPFTYGRPERRSSEFFKLTEYFEWRLSGNKDDLTSFIDKGTNMDEAIDIEKGTSIDGKTDIDRGANDGLSSLVRLWRSVLVLLQVVWIFFANTLRHRPNRPFQLDVENGLPSLHNGLHLTLHHRR